MAELEVLIPWKDRLELTTCLHENSRFLSGLGLDTSFTVINCGGDPDLMQKLISEADCSTPLSLVHVDYQPFNKSLALNIGIARADSRFVMVLDTDVLLKELPVANLISALEKGHFITIGKVFEQKPVYQEFPEADAIEEIAYHVEFKSKDGRTARVEMNREGLNDQSRGAPGLIIARLEDLKKVGGYNAELEGWGWEDIDLIVRLQLEGGLERVRAGRALHMTHDDSLRSYDQSLGSKKANEQQNFRKCLINYRLGLFEGTLAEDAERFAAIINQQPH